MLLCTLNLCTVYHHVFLMCKQYRPLRCSPWAKGKALVSEVVDIMMSFRLFTNKNNKRNVGTRLNCYSLSLRKFIWIRQWSAVFLHSFSDICTSIDCLRGSNPFCLCSLYHKHSHSQTLFLSDSCLPCQHLQNWSTHCVQNFFPLFSHDHLSVCITEQIRDARADSMIL